MQCAAIEFARNVCNISNANSTEFVKDLKPEEQVKFNFLFFINFFFTRLLLKCQSMLEKIWEWVEQCVWESVLLFFLLKIVF